MENKRLRVMILEDDFFQRLSIERMLNSLGYYAVTGMSSASEVFSVLRYATQAFDLVIANVALAEDAGIDFRIGCNQHQLVRHILIYESATSVFEPALGYRASTIRSVLSRPPDSRSIRNFMRAIERGALVPVTAIRLD